MFSFFHWISTWLRWNENTWSGGWILVPYRFYNLGEHRGWLSPVGRIFLINESSALTSLWFSKYTRTISFWFLFCLVFFFCQSSRPELRSLNRWTDSHHFFLFIRIIFTIRWRAKRGVWVSKEKFLEFLEYRFKIFWLNVLNIDFFLINKNR